MAPMRKDAPPFVLELVRWQQAESALRAVRTAVFIAEQGIDPADEWDEADADCLHVLASCDGRAVGTGRLLPDGRIGRMAVMAEFRGAGMGSAMLQRLMAAAAAAGHAETTLHAQVAVLPFYRAHGFAAIGTVFDECGIPHQRMRAPATACSGFVPHLTVAAVIERDGKFLLVEEAPRGRRVVNQPAGHVEAHETVLDAVVREVREETGLRFIPEAILGFYQWPRQDGETYFRVTFCGRTEGAEAAPLDPDILRTVWLAAEEIRSLGSHGQPALRSRLVVDCVEDYLAGRRLPLDLVRTLREFPV
jgi:predicted GNAT family N-acyltransferase/ADP-ribose pyrophosphatase YjhB (NUDIX family)